MKTVPVLFLTLLMLTGCSLNASRGASTLSEGSPTRVSPEVIMGEEALLLFGITPDPVAAATPTVYDQPWFPMYVWVSASVLPYEDGAPIRILPVYSDPTLDLSGTWLGDLEEGTRVTLYGVDQVGHACYMGGRVIQGWEIEGWVACNRLLFEEPTRVPDELDD